MSPVSCALVRDRVPGHSVQKRGHPAVDNGETVWNGEFTENFAAFWPLLLSPPVNWQAGRWQRRPERTVEAWGEQVPTPSHLHQGRMHELWKTLWVPQICFLFYFFKLIYSFIYLAAPDPLVLACRVFNCSPWDQFSDQGSNPGPLHWDCSLNHWTTRKVSLFSFNWLLLE